MTSDADNLALLRARHPEAHLAVEEHLPAPPEPPPAAPAPIDLGATRVGELPCTVVFGFGDGTLVERALELCPPTGRIVVCVLDPVRMAWALTHRDLRLVLSDPRLTLLAGSLRDVAAGMPRPHGEEIEVLVAPGLRDAARADLAPLVSMAEELGHKRRSDQRQRRHVLDNIERNLETIFEGRGARTLERALAGRAALVIAPGPSLESQREVLREGARPFVVALDTSLRTLEHWEVPVDLAFTLDPTPGNLAKFGGLSMDAPLAFVESARPEPVAQSSAPIFLCEEQGLLDQAHPWFGGRGRVRSGGSVLHAAVDALLRAGTRSIALAGTDLAVGAQAHHVDGVVRAAREPAGREVPARGGGSIETTESLWRHWRRLRRLIASSPEGLIVDVTARGASLEPAPRVALADWLAGLAPSDLEPRLEPPPRDPAPAEARRAARDALARARERLPGGGGER